MKKMSDDVVIDVGQLSRLVGKLNKAVSALGVLHREVESVAKRIAAVIHENLEVELKDPWVLELEIKHVEATKRRSHDEKEKQ